MSPAVAFLLCEAHAVNLLHWILVLRASRPSGHQAVHELGGLVGEANSLLATSTGLEAKYLALPSYAERRNSMQLLEDVHVRLPKIQP